MHLTEEEKQMLYGEQGEAVRLAMQFLIEIGETYGAEKMVPVSSVHAGCVYPQFGAAVELMEKFSELGGKFRVLTTANPILNPSNCSRWPRLQEPNELKEAAIRQTNALLKMGVIPNWSCTPYFQGNLPHFGEFASWEESSAVIFVNSVLGGRTNRTTPGFDIASSITGRTAAFGLLLDENRRGDSLVRLEVQPTSLFDYGTIGFIIGKLLAGRVPVIVGLPIKTNTNQLKSMGAAMAIKGGISMYHAIGISPEARNEDEAFKGRKPDIEININDKDVEAAIEELNTIRGDTIDAVATGCPHATVEEFRELARLLEGKKISQEIDFCLFAAGSTIALSKRMGYIDVIENAGVKIFEGGCIVCHSTKLWGWKNIATDSAKYACILPSNPNNLNVRYTVLQECVELATS